VLGEEVGEFDSYSAEVGSDFESIFESTENVLVGRATTWIPRLCSLISSRTWPVVATNFVLRTMTT